MPIAEQEAPVETGQRIMALNADDRPRRRSDPGIWDAKTSHVVFLKHSGDYTPGKVLPVTALPKEVDFQRLMDLEALRPAFPDEIEHDRVTVLDRHQPAPGIELVLREKEAKIQQLQQALVDARSRIRELESRHAPAPPIPSPYSPALFAEKERLIMQLQTRLEAAERENAEHRAQQAVRPAERQDNRPKK